MGARQEDLRPALLAANIVDVGADAIAVAENFARQHFVAPHDGFAAAEIDHHVAVFDAFDDAVDDVADPILVLVILTIALGLAHFLHDHLLGRLCGDAAVFERRQLVGDGVADLGGRVMPAGFLESDLERRVFDRVDDQHMAGQMKFAALRIDLGAHFGLAAIARARGLGDRLLHGAEHDLAIDRLFPGDRIGDLQEFEFIGANGRHL